MFVIGVAFVLRVLAGSSAVGVDASTWIVLMTFLLALFLALAKRRDDVVLAGEGMKVRRSIDGYNLVFVDSAMVIMASVVIVAYILYTISGEVQDRLGSDKLFYTVVFVILGILRFLQAAVLLACCRSKSRS